jgi:hypothetical protein
LHKANLHNWREDQLKFRRELPRFAASGIKDEIPEGKVQLNEWQLRQMLY